MGTYKYHNIILNCDSELLGQAEAYVWQSVKYAWTPITEVRHKYGKGRQFTSVKGVGLDSIQWSRSRSIGMVQ